MKKLFFKQSGSRYWIVFVDNTNISGWYIMQTTRGFVEKFFFMRGIFKDSELEILHLALEPIQDSKIIVLPVLNQDIVVILSEDYFKERIELEFNTAEKEIAFEDLYIAYRNKREKEVPQIKLSLEDWEALQKKWKQIKKEQPKYIVFELDDSGPLDKVDVYGKDELSQEDMDYIKQEHEKYLKYEKARQKYIQNHPDYSEVWRGPQDDEYEADIMQYYDQD